jgi:hypothetical protein
MTLLAAIKAACPNAERRHCSEEGCAISSPDRDEMKRLGFGSMLLLDGQSIPPVLPRREARADCVFLFHRPAGNEIAALVIELKSGTVDTRAVRRQIGNTAKAVCCLLAQHDCVQDLHLCCVSRGRGRTPAELKHFKRDFVKPIRVGQFERSIAHARCGERVASILDKCAREPE